MSLATFAAFRRYLCESVSTPLELIAFYFTLGEIGGKYAFSDIA